MGEPTLKSMYSIYNCGHILIVEWEVACGDVRNVHRFIGLSLDQSVNEVSQLLISI